jgi:hypothetical protein
MDEVRSPDQKGEKKTLSRKGTEKKKQKFVVLRK